MTHLATRIDLHRPAWVAPPKSAVLSSNFGLGHQNCGTVINFIFEVDDGTALFGIATPKVLYCRKLDL